jgi:hypothetical protein
MTRILRTSRRVALTVLLASSLTGLALLAGMPTTSHAAGILFPTPAPTITATSPNSWTLVVTGHSFTPGGTVDVTATDSLLHDQTGVVVTATRASCSPTTGLCSMGGDITATITVNACQAGVLFSVQAYNVATKRYSNVATVYDASGGLCIP